ncbi:uncharacterized protein L969DRAFT_97437 [Mixia osmundae IAM 14324]|uniref:Nucleolar complex-associated protein 3 n=1 Tax=Mixia osmundae (strain CBS 9802 / IAM 14324 / JCM 22182 / KY 12970) TaxID=764103 RepID=G7E4I9_MIXOS|nr:uncharacterized protein L969DRAFT_97437 [Mixia osmundae IAM 14324]KEI36234.1 hypothetical protein L969DRAFT_97437 [Mixia osmundae IAM 14324]GAA97749.1 hypothetical protein E5Q_04428 [Mixia osmundae IAM 14324]
MGAGRKANGSRSSYRSNATNAPASTKTAAKTKAPKRNAKTAKRRNETIYIAAPDATAAQRGLDDNASDQDDAGMAIDEDLQDLGDMADAFLTGLDHKNIAKSRASIAQEHKHFKATAPRPARPVDKLPKVSLPPAVAAVTAKPAIRSVNGKGKEKAREEDVESDMSGEALDALDEDDFAFGSGDSDDELSLMSDIDDDSDEDMSDPESLASEDEDISLDSELSGDEDSEEEMSEHESDIERDFEERYAKRRPDEQQVRNQRLPVISGKQIQRRERSTSPDAAADSKSRATFEAQSDTSEEAPPEPVPVMNPFGARFGRPAVQAVLEIDDLKARILAARVEIAQLGRDIISDPEQSLNLLKRLLSFAAPSFKVPATQQSLKVPPAIRVMAIMSLLAVFLDIIPGYRIRPVTAAEKQSRVSQVIQRQREWEEGLVGSYKKYLTILEKETKDRMVVSAVAFKCMCELAKTKTHFNFAPNIMDVLIKKLARRGWDETSDQCLAAIVTIFANDLSGADSLHIVRLINRMARAKEFNIHPGILTCLLHLRLRDDLGNLRASDSRVDRPIANGQANGAKVHGRDVGKKNSLKEQHISKKVRKARKDRAGIVKEIAEAEESISKETREKNQTETLKMTFSLYFRILKSSTPSPLLPAALEGLTRFAHLANVDFFKDLLAVLRGLAEDDWPSTNDSEYQTDAPIPAQFRRQLLCIVTAFELLSGQGSALNLDLSAFVTRLYTLLRQLALSTTLEERPELTKSAQLQVQASERIKAPAPMTTASEADLIFRALSAVFLSSRTQNSPTRTLAFTKRLLLCTLHWPPTTVLRTCGLIKRLLVKEPILQSMLLTEDRQDDGIYKPEVDDPALCNPSGALWHELVILESTHYDDRVRSAARELATWTPE